jgi:hypothetical protein
MTETPRDTRAGHTDSRFYPATKSQVTVLPATPRGGPLAGHTGNWTCARGHGPLDMRGRTFPSRRWTYGP